MIPKLIHFVWIGPPMPDWARRNIEEFRRLNPDHDIRVHGREVLHPDYAPMYDRCEGIRVVQADLLRYSAIERFGGWYFDVDYWPFRPVADIESAYGLDGKRLVVTEQHGQKNRLLHIANGCLASEAGQPAWAFIRNWVAGSTVRAGKNAFGPALMTKLIAKRGDLFQVLRWPFFYPAAGGDAVHRFKRLAAGEDPRSVLWDLIHQTLGQLPFVMHMWMNGRAELPAYDPAADGIDADRDKAPPPFDGMRVGLVATRQQWLDEQQCFQHLSAGLERLGCNVQVAEPGDWPCFIDPQLVLMWNGRKALYMETAAGARAAGVPMLVMEHGFFDRRAYSQIDHQGILHWASWTNQLHRPAPAEGAARLQAVWPRPLEPVRARQNGNVLVLGQVPGDSQMDESPMRDPDDLIKAVAKAIPAGLQPVFRPHPRRAKHTAVPREMPASGARNLADAVAQARFAITINSNAGNECLAMGLPVLAYGPALYLRAGVARQAQPETLRDDIQAMAAGWAPDPGRVTNYLHWLAARQWNVHEMASGHVLARLIQKAVTAA